MFLGKGQMGSALLGSLQTLCVFYRGGFWVPPLTYFYLPKSAGAYLFPQTVKIHYLCSGPVRVDPICPQPNPLCLTRCTHVFRVDPISPQPRTARRPWRCSRRARGGRAASKRKDSNKSSDNDNNDNSSDKRMCMCVCVSLSIYILFYLYIYIYIIILYYIIYIYMCVINIWWTTNVSATTFAPRARRPGPFGRYDSSTTY